MYESYYSPFSYGQLVGQTMLFNLDIATDLRKVTTLNSNLLISA